MKKPLTPAMQEIEKLQTQVQEAEVQNISLSTRNHHLGAELVALERRRNQLRVEIEAETERLKAESRKQVKASIAKLQIEQRELKRKISSDSSTVSILLSQEIDAIERLKGLNDRINEAEFKLSALTDDVKLAEGDLATAKEGFTVIRATADHQQEQLSQLLESKLDLIEAIQQLKTEAVGLKTANDQVQAETSQQLSEAKAEIKRLEHKKDLIKQSIFEEQTQQDIVRRDLAARVRAADEHDTNLKLRERKVMANESDIQRNINLLDL